MLHQNDFLKQPPAPSSSEILLTPESHGRLADIIDKLGTIGSASISSSIELAHASYKEIHGVETLDSNTAIGHFATRLTTNESGRVNLIDIPLLTDM